MKPPKPKACAGCPFRRTSAPGWLGSSTVREFIDCTYSDHEMPCHDEVDYDDPKWKTKTAKVHQCTGRAIFLTNIAKMPRNKNIVRLPRDTKLFFGTRDGFELHHTPTIDEPACDNCGANNPTGLRMCDNCATEHCDECDTGGECSNCGEQLT